LHSGRFQAPEKPRNKAKANDEKKKRRTCHNIWFRPCIKIVKKGALV
tara:strand:- start:252 stop:392 length:141 start_codon:yes stop_codon:yes gene_type:complete